MISFFSRRPKSTPRVSCYFHDCKNVAAVMLKYKKNCNGHLYCVEHFNMYEDEAKFYGMQPDFSAVCDINGYAESLRKEFGYEAAADYVKSYRTIYIPCCQ